MLVLKLVTKVIESNEDFQRICDLTKVTCIIKKKLSGSVLSDNFKIFWIKTYSANLLVFPVVQFISSVPKIYGNFNTNIW